MKKLSNYLLLLLSVLLWTGCTKEEVTPVPSATEPGTTIATDDIKAGDLHTQARAY